MQSLSAALMTSIALFAMHLPAAAVTEGVPKLDVAQSCREAQAIGGDDKNLAYKGCMQDENDAHEQLKKQWSHFKAADRRDCVAQGVAPMPSYVEILTCLEMYDGASAFHRPTGEGLRTPPAGSAPMAASPSPLPSGAPAPADGAEPKP